MNKEVEHSFPMRRVIIDRVMNLFYRLRIIHSSSIDFTKKGSVNRFMAKLYEGDVVVIQAKRRRNNT